MLCQNCKKTPAMVHFVKVINGEKTEMHLCEKCAAQMQKSQQMPSFSFNIGDMLGNLFSIPQTYAPEAQCKTCGMTYNRFTQTGKLGCSDCYDAFGSLLDAPLKQIHGAVRHVGKRPGSAAPSKTEPANELETLKAQLSDLIAKEDFENAAIVRDKIRALEGGAGK